MKTNKTILALIIGSTIILGISSFKSEDPFVNPKEVYGMLRVYEGYKEEIVFYTNGEKKGYVVNKKHMELEEETAKVINEYLNSGWRIISTDFMAASNNGDGSVKNIKYYHFVRNK